MALWATPSSTGSNGISTSIIPFPTTGTNSVGLALVEDWLPLVEETLPLEERLSTLPHGLNLCLSWPPLVLLQLSFWFGFLGSGFLGLVACLMEGSPPTLVDDVAKFLSVTDFWVAPCFSLCGMDFCKRNNNLSA